MINYEDEYGVLDMSDEAMNTLELMHQKLDDDGCGPEDASNADNGNGAGAGETGGKPSRCGADK